MGLLRMLRYFSEKEVSHILGIKPSRLKYWKQIGLVAPSRRRGALCYDFQDLIYLKTTQGLIARGLPATSVKQSLESLKKKIPDIERNLNSQQVYAFGNRVLIRHRNRLMDTRSGQLVFEFDIEDRAEIASEKVVNFSSSKTAEEWFEEGLAHDSPEGSFERALGAYESAIQVNPNYVDAYVNIGTLYYNRQKFEKAQRYYRQALARDPHHAKAYFNLGNVLDELGCSDKAIELYEKAIQVDSSFSDAYFNLATICEKLGIQDTAIKHWTSYLKLDSNSQHADFARRRLKLLRSLSLTS